jgi:hypothetical protein
LVEHRNDARLQLHPASAVRQLRETLREFFGSEELGRHDPCPALAGVGLFLTGVMAGDAFPAASTSA